MLLLIVKILGLGLVLSLGILEGCVLASSSEGG